MKPDSRIDLLAQHAARLFHEGSAATINDAIRTAIQETGWTLVPAPPKSLVRRHVQGLTLQTIGLEAYEQRIIDFWLLALDVLILFQDCAPRLLGRAAKGQIDGGATIYIRVFSDQRIGWLADRAAAHFGIDPEFSTADSPHFGRFDRMTIEIESQQIVITRCPMSRSELIDVDLFTARPIASLTIDDLEARLRSARERLRGRS